MSELRKILGERREEKRLRALGRPKQASEETPGEFLERLREQAAEAVDRIRSRRWLGTCASEEGEGSSGCAPR